MKTKLSAGIADTLRETGESSAAAAASARPIASPRPAAKLSAESPLAKLPRAAAASSNSTPQIAEGTEVWRHAFLQNTKKPSAELNSIAEQIARNPASAADHFDVSADEKETLQNLIADVSKLPKAERSELVKQDLSAKLEQFAASLPTSGEVKAELMRDLHAAASKLPEAPKNGS